MAAIVRAATDSDDVTGWIRRSWGDTVVVVHDELHDVTSLPAIVAVDDKVVRGVLTYTVVGDELEIVSCDADPSGTGNGRRLVNAIVDVARDQGLRQLRCTTTNDNLPALGFWQSVGFRLVALRPDGVDAARRRKASIPAYGYRGLPIRDELDLELSL